MLRIGLTGGLASGKSSVAAILRDFGAVVFDADEIVRELYEPGGAGAQAAKELFGDAVLDASGNVDRSRIAEIVFADAGKRHALEAKIHPLVHAERARRFAEAEKGGAAVAVGQASQLFESNSESDYDRVLLIVAPDAERLRRWEEKGQDAEDGRRRMAAQIAADAARSRAHDVIVNDGSLDDLRRKVSELYDRWVAAAETRGGDSP